MTMKLNHYITSIMLPKTIAYLKSYDGQTKWMYFLIENDGLLGKYNTIWDKVSTDIKKEFDREPIYENPKVDSNQFYLSLIILIHTLINYYYYYY